MPRSKSPKPPSPATESTIGPFGRVEMTIDQVPIAARLRFENAEKWVAWAPDYKSIVASGVTHQEVREAAQLAGHPHAYMEWIPPVTGQIWE